MPLRVTLTDYGVGNLYSIRRSLENCGAKVDVIRDMSGLKDAECIVFPGVGAFDKTMEKLLPHRDEVRDMLMSGTPALGICIGMQILYEAYGWDKNGGRNTNHRQFMPTSDLVDMLRDHNDPRLRVYIDPRITLGDDVESGFAIYSRFGLENEYYVGIPYGQASPPREWYTSTTGTGLLAGGADKSSGRLRSSTFIAGSEVGFLLAEAALKGFIPGGETQAKQYYEEAVTSAFKRHEAAMQEPTENYSSYVNEPMVGMKDPIPGTAEQAAREYLSQNDDFCNWDLMQGNKQIRPGFVLGSKEEHQLYAICAQRWLAFVGYNPLEAWIELRRTDYPYLECSNQFSVYKNISRLPYPQTERDLNAENVMAEPEVDIFESKVFWDLYNPQRDRAELYQ